MFPGVLALLALLGAWIFSRAPLVPDDPFRGTLIVLPVVVLGLAEIGRWARAHGGSGPPRSVTLVEAASLGALVLLILGRGGLGLGPPSPAVDGLVAAGLFVLLGHRVVHLLRSLRPALGDEVPRRPPWPFFALPLLAYLAVMPWSVEQRPPDGDEPYYLLIAHSLAYDGDIELTDNYERQDSLAFVPRALEPEWADPKGPDGEIYSRHNMLFPLLLAPVYRLTGIWGAYVVVAVLTALVAWMSLRLAGRLWPRAPGATLLVWSLLALTPPLLLYSHQIWVEVPAALLVLVALDRIRGLSEGAGRGSWLVLLASVVLLPLLKLRLVLLAGPLVLLAWMRVPRSRRLLGALALVLVLVAAGMLAYNQAQFGNPFKDHTWSQLKRLQQRPPLDYARGALGLLWDCAFGLFAVNPVWLILLPALFLLARRRDAQVVNLLVLSLPYMAVVSPRLEWYGAWSPPFRLGLVLLPVLALCVVPLLDGPRSSATRSLVAGLAAVGAGLGLLWLVAPGWTYNTADGTGHLLGYLNERFGSDVGRLFPSFVRYRTATLVWLLISLALLPLAWWLPGRWRRAGSWGIGLALLAAAAVPVAAGRLPTRVIEMEDRQVVKRGGEVHPSPWVPARPRFRGGWKIRPGDEIVAPVVSGGASAVLEIDLRPITARQEGCGHLRVTVAERTVAVWEVEGLRGWRTLTWEVADWPVRGHLGIRFEAGSASGDSCRILLDRARIRWR